jgi:hypothetical protein
MRDTIQTPSTNPGSVGKFRDEQLRNRQTWAIVPDDQVALAAMHAIHIVPMGSTTCTYVNPLDPATVADTAAGWLATPGAAGPVVKAGRT